MDTVTFSDIVQIQEFGDAHLDSLWSTSKLPVYIKPLDTVHTLNTGESYPFCLNLISLESLLNDQQVTHYI